MHLNTQWSLASSLFLFVWLHKCTILYSFANKIVVELGVGVVREFDDIACMFTTWHYAQVRCFFWVQCAHTMHLNFNYFVFFKHTWLCVYFIALQFSLLANWALVLCIVGEFNIGVAYLHCEFCVEHVLWWVWCLREFVRLLFEFNKSTKVSFKLCTSFNVWELDSKCCLKY